VRDANASTLEDLFGFDNAPSLGAEVSLALAPAANNGLRALVFWD